MSSFIALAIAIGKVDKISSDTRSISTFKQASERNPSGRGKKKEEKVKRVRGL